MEKIEIFDKKIDEIYRLAGEQSGLQGDSVSDLRRKEFRAMAETFLGEEYSDNRLQEVESLQAELYDWRAKWLTMLEAGQIEPSHYVTMFNSKLDAVFRRCEQILGKKDFLELFGAPVEELGGYIDEEIFLATFKAEKKNNGSQQRGAD